MSDPKSEYTEAPEDIASNINELLDAIQAGMTIKRHPASRFAFSKLNNTALLFIDGNDYPVSELFAESICNNRELNINCITSANQQEQKLILKLYNSGSIYLSNT